MITFGLVLAVMLQSSGSPTFNKDIAPIIYKNCSSCHRIGEVAPFELLRYSDVAKRAKLISTVTAKRYMPPWKPEPGFGDFKDAHRLTDAEIALIQRWADAGAPEGDPAQKLEAPHFTDGWQLGQPDLVVQMTEAFTVPADGRDIYRCFVVPLNLPEDKFVSAIEYRPGNRKVVHHAILHVEQPGADRTRDAADPGPGYSCFGGGGLSIEGGLGGWVPGSTPQFFPDGVARSIPKGSDLIIQNHYHPSGKAETDQSSVGIYFSKKPPTKTVFSIPLVQRNLYIPAGNSRYKVEASFTTPIDIQVLGIAPHMHLLGKEIQVTATLPDGTERSMIWIKNWDFNWQGSYSYAEPVRLPAGTRFHMEAYYDNSSDNPRNPNNPPKPVRWGEQTTDEMAVTFIQCISNAPSDPRTMFMSLAEQLSASGRGGRGGRGQQNSIASIVFLLQALSQQMANYPAGLDKEQFRKLIPQRPETADTVFERLDLDGDGKITADEVKRIIELLQPALNPQP